MSNPSNKNFNQVAGSSTPPTDLIVPTVIEESAQGRVSYDPISRLLQDRIIKLDGPIDGNTATLITAQLLILEAQNDKKDIMLYIDSPGGSVSAGMAIFDTMKQVKCDIVTIGMGTCASMGSFLLAAGTKGKRFALPNTRIMTHQPSAGTEGKVTDMENMLDEFKRTKEKMRAYYEHFLDVTSEEFVTLYERDTFFNSLAAEKLGHIDKVVMRGPESGEKDNSLSEDDKELFRLELSLMEEENKSHPVIGPILERKESESQAKSSSNDNTLATVSKKKSPSAPAP